MNKEDIYKKNIDEIFNYFTKKFLEDKKISGTDLAKLTEILIDHEISTGGPYKNLEGKVDFKTNLAIEKFLVTQDIKLPKLRRYLDKYSEENVIKNKPPLKKENVYEKVLIQIEKELKKLFPENRDMLNRILDIFGKISRNEKKNLIILIPFLTKDCLKKEFQKKIDDKFLLRLSLVNTLGWIAYTIYDDVVDKDRELEWIPIANLVSRRMNIIFTELLPENKRFKEECNEIFNKMESANYWELTKCKVGSKNLVDFDGVEKISDRSMGHVLTTIALFYKAGISEINVFYMKEFYRYFLAARQMNDDAHDWENDFKMNRINSASAMLLSEIDSLDITELKLYFWKFVFDNYSKDILEYCKISNEYILKTDCMSNMDLFKNMVEKIQNSILTAIDEKQKSIEFINEYCK